MSDAPREARPEGISGVLGVGFLLVLIAVGGSSALLQRTRTLEPAEVFADWFAPGPLPFGFELAEAGRQPGGETLLRMCDPTAPTEAERAEPAPEPDASQPKSGAAARFDWSAIAIGSADSAPTEALFATWPLQAARKQVAALFSAPAAPDGGDRPEQGGGVDPLAGLGREGGRRVLRAGRVPWGEFEAPYVHERSFEPGGTFVDTLRVNLSSKSEALVLFLRWPRGSPASTARAEEFLSGLVRGP